MPLKIGLIFLHGSGSNGNEMRNILNTLPLETYKYNSFVDILINNLGWELKTPTADMIPYDVCDGEVMNCWFNRKSTFQWNGF